MLCGNKVVGAKNAPTLSPVVLAVGRILAELHALIALPCDSLTTKEPKAIIRAQCSTGSLFVDHVDLDLICLSKTVYFDIPVEMDAEPNARAEVEVGELAYWPQGNAFYIFLGPTPMSTDDKPVAASPVNIIGRVLGNAALFRAIQYGDTVRVEVAE